jgi:putative methionine-R-sulfoxide reductase with GAF domain
MNQHDIVFAEVSGLYRIIPLKVLRRTPGVSFDVVPGKALPRVDALDRVIHQQGAVSPGPVGDVKRPWYMHTHQDDNLIVLHGTRYVEIYTVAHGEVESFTVTPHQIKKGDQTVFDGAALLVWPRGVFHRIRSCEKEGSASLNLAVHYPGFDIRTNFSVYDLNPETGQYHVIRQGHLDQPGGEIVDDAYGSAGRAGLYERLALQLSGLLQADRDLMANAANTASLIYHGLPELNWTGFYFLKDDELRLGPFQGEPACARIPVGKGACGKAAKELQTLVVVDVHQFPGHIACQAASNSEIVVPLVSQRGRLIGVLDLDSPLLGRFDDEDRAGLERLVQLFVASTEVDAG